jgi:hypothetical protein
MGLITQTAYQYYKNSEKFITTANQAASSGHADEGVYTLTLDPLPSAESKFFILVSGNEVDDNLYSYNSSTGAITFTTGYAVNTQVIVKLKASSLGNYRYISLTDIINNYMIAYVGDGKLINATKRTDVLFHAKRGIQEFSYDIARTEKILEVEVGASLSIPMPQDYIHYVRISYVDEAGIEHIVYPSRYTSKPSLSILQDSDYEYLYDDDGTILRGTSLTDSRFQAFNVTNISGGLSSDDIDYDADRSAERIIEFGKRYGLTPETSQKNGVFIIDEVNGSIGFSSDMSGRLVTVKYVSDGLGTDDEMKIHKYAEDAIYKYITYGIASAKANFPEYIINRFRKERRAAMRNAKIRLSSFKLAELEQVMRNKSKFIKH